MNRRVVDGLRRGLERLAELVLPEACQLCGAAAQGPACPGCRADLPWIGPACPLCARPRPADVPGALPCGRCLRRPPPWDAAVSALAWHFPVDRLVGRLKYGGAVPYARLLGEALALAVADRAADVILPVPLHPARQAQRGFNQATELARPVGRRLGVPLDPGLCRRTRPTDPQAGLPARARRRNVRGAFTVHGDVSGLAVAVVDDVLTTGATVSELAKALAAAGAVRVEVWTAARAGLQAARKV